jgi:hypothetical protein
VAKLNCQLCTAPSPRTKGVRSKATPPADVPTKRKLFEIFLAAALARATHLGEGEGCVVGVSPLPSPTGEDPHGIPKNVADELESSRSLRIEPFRPQLPRHHQLEATR